MGQMFRECLAVCLLAGTMSAGCGGHARSSGEEGEPALSLPPATVSYCADDASPRALLPARFGLSVVAHIDVRDAQLLFSTPYVTDSTFGRDGEVTLVDLQSGAQRLLASGRQGPRNAVIGGQDAYWIESGAALNLVRAPLDGGGQPTTEVAATNGTVVVDDYLYYARDGAVMALPVVNGGQGVQVSTEPPALELASDGEYIYFSSCGKGIERVHKLGGEVQHVTDAFCAVAVAADKDQVFFANIESGGSFFKLFRAPTTGGPAEPFLDDSVHPLALAVDADSVYVGDEQGLHRIRRAVGEPELLAKGYVTDVALDEHCVYFVDGATRNPYVLRKD